MIKNFTNGMSGLIHYRGSAGQLAFLMQRLSGLGVLVFLSMHILLESTAHFAPQLYEKLNAGLRNPIMLAAEIFMAFLIIFHGVNGYRIAYFDLFHVDLWSFPSAPQSARITWIISVLLWLPAFIIMALHSLRLI